MIKLKTCKLEFSSTTCQDKGWRNERNGPALPVVSTAFRLMFLYFTTLKKKLGGKKSKFLVWVGKEGMTLSRILDFLISDLASVCVPITQHTALVASSHFFEHIIPAPTSGPLHLLSPLPRMLSSLLPNPPALYKTWFLHDSHLSA